MQASDSSPHRSVHPPRTVALAVAIVAAALLFAAGLAPGEAGARSFLGGSLSGTTSQGNPGRINGLQLGTDDQGGVDH